MALIAACSGTVEDTGESESAIKGRWTLPSDLRAAGAKVRLAYEEAPEWTNTKACGGKLRPGSRVLGEYLMDNFAVISSIGGYACRRNTADRGRMSVHGTGRALDIFIPKTKGTADNVRGDKVANWLVVNAQSIGVQLIIWDRSIWRANGTNDRPYGGPVSHDDHLHVELTASAAARTTTWFKDNADAGEVDASIDANETADSSTEADAEPEPEPEPEPDASVPPTPIDSGVDAAVAPPVEVPAPAESPPVPSDGPTELPVTEGDEAGETSSLPTRPPRTPPAVREDEEAPSSGGCSTAPGPRAPAVGGGLVLLLGLAAWRRRRP